jgi:MscS family membrane protein
MPCAKNGRSCDHEFVFGRSVVDFAAAALGVASAKGRRPLRRATRAVCCLSIALLIVVLFGHSSAAVAGDINPLAPVDASSPRATLQGFTTVVDGVYRRMKALRDEYFGSDQLYLTPEQRQTQTDTIRSAAKSVDYLDLSNVAPVLKTTVALERILQLKEILDRIDVPPFDQIPDQAEMARSGAKKWRLPNTEIDIVLVENGPRAGNYLVSPDTIDRLPEFYERVKSLPYKPGAGKDFADSLRAISSDKNLTIYGAFASSPLGLDRIVPTRWMMQLPDWARISVAGVTAWQWLGFTLGLLLGGLFIFGISRLARRLSARQADESGPGWTMLLTPLAILLVVVFLLPLLCLLLRIGGTPRLVIAFIQTGAEYVAAAWLAVIAGRILGEAITASEHLARRSLDSQLVRLGARFAGIVIAVGFLIQGANELGFPAYSVLAGLGVGGLAVALAARDSLANLLGSMLIMIEKPFRVGHVIRVSGSEGTVEEVGFRSTRIRTSDNSLISIPNNAVVNATVENLSLRPKRRQRFFVQLTYDTPREKVEEVVSRIKQLIADHPVTDETGAQVRFNDFGESSLNILVQFHLNVADAASELEEREKILLQIIDLAKEIGVEFAFPTRTLIVETSPGEAKHSPLLPEPARSKLKPVS